MTVKPQIIGDERCPECAKNGGDKTGNHLMIFDNGDKYCNRCGYHVSGSKSKTAIPEDTQIKTLEDVQTLPFMDLTDRSISKQVAELFGVRVEIDEATGEPKKHYYPYYSKDGSTLVAYKVRVLADKSFYSIGDMKKASMFGQNIIGANGKMLVITEGELDAMAAYEMFLKVGKKYRVASVPNGANGAPRSVKDNLEHLNKFDSIIIAFDQDDPGKTAAAKMVELFDPGKVRVMRFSEKDPNAMLIDGLSKQFLQSLYDSKVSRPDGIVTGADTWKALQDKPKKESVPYPEDWEELNKKTYGVRIGELDTWTSGSGMGKTAALRELQYHLLQNTDRNMGIIALEEPLVDSVEALMALHLNKRIQLPDVSKQVTDEERYEAWLATSGTNRIHYYDHFGSVDEDSLVAKIKYLARGLDCKYIFLDHLSIVVSEFADQGGERERIDTIMTKLKNLTQELDIWIGLVVHLRKVGGGGKSFETGGVPSLDDLRGSGSIKQLSNSVYALSRNQQHPDDKVRNTSTMHVLKCRFTGRTGQADHLLFDDKTGRLHAVDDFDVEEEEQEF